MKLKLATPKEMKLYTRVIHPTQNKILEEIGKAFGTGFYLSDGTALSRFYFRHRLSKDLYLLTETENIKAVLPKILGLIENFGCKVTVEFLSVSFGKLSIFLENEVKLQINLAADNPIENPKAVKNFHIDSIANIAANKLSSLETKQISKI